MRRCFIYNVLIRMNQFLAKLNKLDRKPVRTILFQTRILTAVWYNVEMYV